MWSSRAAVAARLMRQRSARQQRSHGDGSCGAGGHRQRRAGCAAGKREVGSHQAGDAGPGAASEVEPQVHPDAGAGPAVCAAGRPDWIGGFCVTAGHGIDETAAAFGAGHDDYNAVLVKALGDRLAEAFAEWLHERVRREYWGYTPDEALDNADLIAERYRGIRPAPGYPACPEHTEKRRLFALLEAERHTGVRLTESCAMLPAAAVSGWYFSHPAARYFGIGKIGRHQVADYAARKGWSLAEAERWLAPNLGHTATRQAV